MSKENILIGTINYGTRGRDGVSVVDVRVNTDNTITFLFSNGTEQTTSPILIDGSATNYESLGNLPRINSVEIKGNKTLEDYGLDLSNYYNKLEIDNKIDNINIPETDLSNYYNKQETDNQIDTKISQIEIPETDLTDYYTKNETNSQIDTKISQIDLTDYARKNEIPNSVSQLTNDSNYATESYVATKISEAQLAEGDLTNYYTKSETDSQIDTKISQIPQVDLSNYATKSEIPDVSGFATREEIPSTVGLATENYVNSKFDSIEIPDVSGFQLKNELATVATTGSYNDLTDLPNSQIVVGNEPGNSDIWIDTTGGETLGFATVAFSGSYNDLTDKPDIYTKSETYTKLEIEQLIADQIGGIENGSY